MSKYELERVANARVTKELEAANKDLLIAINQLDALKAGLEAATAATLAV